MNLKAPRLGDSLIATGLLVVALVTALADGQPVLAPLRDWDALGVLLIAGQTLPLIWRQSYPRAVAWATLIAWMVSVGLGYPSGAGLFGVLIALYGIAAYLPRRTALIHGGTVLGLMLGWTGFGILAENYVPWTAFVQIAFGVTLPMAMGFVDRQRTERLTVLERTQAAREQAEREATTAAVAAERARIARELHDVVAHEMTVMTLQAEGARRMAQGADPRLGEALGTISESGRKGLVEMQRMIGVLREPDVGGAAARNPATASGELSPMPSLATVPALVHQVQDSGMPVRLSMVGDAPVPAGVELNVFRIVQESLTNALKYAGPGAEVSVSVVRAADSVTVTVTDDGRGAAAEPPATAGGHGVLGMRERVEALGGTLQVGPDRGGGYRVHAVLPTGQSARTATERKDVGTIA